MALSFSQQGSTTTLPISYGGFKHKVMWFVGNLFRFNIIRIRQKKKRYEIRKGETFVSYHFSRVSLFKQLKEPRRRLWFKRHTKTMKILELPSYEHNNLPFKRLGKTWS
jgi:hypothetical protein